MVAMTLEVVMEVNKTPIDDAFVDTSVRDPTGLSNQVDPLYTLR